MGLRDAGGVKNFSVGISYGATSTAALGSFLYNNMCMYNTISSHTDHFDIQKRDSEESPLTFVNLFPN